MEAGVVIYEKKKKKNNTIVQMGLYIGLKTLMDPLGDVQKKC